MYLDNLGEVTGNLFERAQQIATAKFQSDTSGKNSDKVCVVAIQAGNMDNYHAIFSGAPGYTELTNIVSNGGNKKAAQERITNTIKEFLRSEEGGDFSDLQITDHGFDMHGRGAMNCAEPKIFYLLKHQLNLSLKTWVIVPFNKNETGIVIYNAPCKNCRRWVYKHFNFLSGLIAKQQKGADAFEE